MKKGLIVVISGPAGCGKGTVIKELLQTDDYVLSVSRTTRAPRPGETDGVQYRFISREEFQEKIDEADFLEYAEYCGELYGTPKKKAEQVLESGKNLLLEIEVDGAMRIKAARPEAVLIMLLPPSHAVQEQRLRGRKTETEEKIIARLQRAREEINFADKYDYVVYNNDGQVKEAADQIMAIVSAESAAIKRNPDVKKIFLGQ